MAFKLGPICASFIKLIVLLAHFSRKTVSLVSVAGVANALATALADTK
jgi:hypothetical protein